MIKPLLQAAIDTLVTRKHPGHMLVGDEAIAWLAGAGLGHGKIDTATGDATGFGPEGMAAVGALAKAIRGPSAAYRRGASYPTFAAAVADQVIATSRANSPPAVDDATVQRFEADLAAWWNTIAGQRRHFIPCAMLPDVADDVVVGPVTFVHASRVVGHPLGLAQDHALTELAWENIERALAERSAAWIAVVDVDGCHPNRSTEIADLAVDVAITAVQLLVPVVYSRLMARITARTAPPWRGNLTVSDGEVSPGIQNNLPALGLTGAAFSEMTSHGRTILDAAGRRLATFVAGQGPLPSIDQAWCDAAYWFHEGLAEPLDTIAAAKLETAVEVLLRSTSSKGSGKRMRQAIEAVTGLMPKDPIAPGSAVNVDEFAKSLVGARSQVLHGTFSTLTAELAPERSSLTGFAHLLLMTFAIQIEAFAVSTSAADDVETLLRWIGARRAASTNPPPATTTP